MKQEDNPYLDEVIWISKETKKFFISLPKQKKIGRNRWEKSRNPGLFYIYAKNITKRKKEIERSVDEKEKNK